jgi:hypothetical protein
VSNLLNSSMNETKDLVPARLSVNGPHTSECITYPMHFAVANDLRNDFLVCLPTFQSSKLCGPHSRVSLGLSRQ